LRTICITYVVNNAFILIRQQNDSQSLRKVNAFISGITEYPQTNACVRLSFNKNVWTKQKSRVAGVHDLHTFPFWDLSSSEDSSQICLFFLRCPTKQLSGIWRMEVIGIMLASEHSVYQSGFQRTVMTAWI